MLFPPAALERAMTIREVVIACRDHAVTLSYTYVTCVKLALVDLLELSPPGERLPL